MAELAMLTREELDCMVSCEAMRRFFALPDEKQNELWAQGIGWTKLEEQVAREWLAAIGNYHAPPHRLH